MSKLIVDISVSLDGYVAGPDPSPQEPLGRGGERLHDWVVATKDWREAHGQSGGEEGIDNQAIADRIKRTGATIMGRKMFSGNEGPWESDDQANGWWGDDPPYRHPVFILTHHARETVTKDNGTSYIFVTDGIESALAQACEAAGDKDVLIAGGGDVIQQYVAAGSVDELYLHVAPILLGGGAPLFGEGDLQRWSLVTVAESPTGVIHLSYRADRNG